MSYVEPSSRVLAPAFDTPRRMDAVETVEAERDLAAHFVELNNHLREDADTPRALGRLAGLAVASLPTCDWAAITTWPVRRRPHSLAISSDVAADADRLQYEIGEGPCLSAATAEAGETVVRVPDLRHEERWPRFVVAARRATPVRAVLSFHIADQPHACALNLYSATPHGFDDAAFDLAAVFAAHARVLLLHAASSDEMTNLRIALTRSRQIGTATGVLMSAYKITADEAFDLLRTSSMRLNRKLHDVADDVTETGALPDAR